MSAHEQLRFFGKQHGFYARCIPSGIAADVGQKYLYPIDGENFNFMEAAAKHSAVDVTIYGPHRCYCRQTVDEFFAADVACVPYFVTFLEILNVTVVPPPVSV